jgi:hypothetical protein
VSPILVRPVREQLEHDRVIRLLNLRWRRKYQVAINPAAELNVPVNSDTAALYPDLVLSSAQRGHRLQAVVEVETAESVNSMEALAQWAQYARLRVPFYLYVPGGSVEAARRLCSDNHIEVSEIWSFYTVGDNLRFAMVHRAAAPARPKPRPAAPAPRKKAAPVGRGKAPVRRAAPKAARKPSSKKAARKTTRAQKRK